MHTELPGGHCRLSSADLLAVARGLAKAKMGAEGKPFPLPALVAFPVLIFPCFTVLASCYNKCWGSVIHLLAWSESSSACRLSGFLLDGFSCRKKAVKRVYLNLSVYWGRSISILLVV